MVDFTRKLASRGVEKPVDPTKLYASLDRAHDKGPLRPAQASVLSQWFASQTNMRDVIVKLHTGQGKTLIGLLMLQSRLNSGKKPVVYLCPDNYLIDQTCEQAKQFGISTCTTTGELPSEFLNGSKILVTSVQKLFNGLTKFGIFRNSVEIDTVLMDDAHACADRIREACRIRIPNDEPSYHAIIALFSSELEGQGVGTFADIGQGKRDCILPIPYWAWIERELDVAKILASATDRKSVKFAWPLLKDMLSHCQCVVSGNALEIEAHIPPLSAFGSYSGAQHRIFMSATVTDDAFLIKGLKLSPDTISKPLSYEDETWSGEKMVLLPSIIHPSLDRESVVQRFAKANSRRVHGIVALVPGGGQTGDWSGYGAKVVDRNSLGEAIAALKDGEYGKTVVLVNRYDGIDLPDDACRILIFDSRPFSESLVDSLLEKCRPNSESTLVRAIRSVEQGMGRSVRGEKDYSVVIAVGSDLVRLLRENSSRRYLSSQMATQIDIGLQIADMAKQDIDEGKTPEEAFDGLIRQCLTRDDGWKAFYVENMGSVSSKGANAAVLDLYAAELEAEEKYSRGDYAAASDALQALIDRNDLDSDDIGWYLQERARYLYVENRADSQKLQVAAHKKNRVLLKPPQGVTVAKLTLVSAGRTERIGDWMKQFSNYADMDATISDILSRLAFGIAADRFEKALDELSAALGFKGERPDAEWKEGPDNLWALDNINYLLFECKSEVDVSRSEINKREAEQMNRSCAWFHKHYLGVNATKLIIHPAGKIESAASFTHPVRGVRQANLRQFVKACREFFKNFEGQNFHDLSAQQIQKAVTAYKLQVDDLVGDTYSVRLKDMKS